MLNSDSEYIILVAVSVVATIPVVISTVNVNILVNNIPLMAKKHSLFECTNCGYQSPKWLGSCPSCNEFGTLSEMVSMPEEMSVLRPLSALTLDQFKPVAGKRISTGFSEFDRVLGGGIAPDSAILLSGDPGIGKSTLLLQLIANVASNKQKAVYITAEESAEQVALRARRIIKGKTDLAFVAAYEINAIIDYIKEEKPEVVVLDSIQTVYSSDSPGLPGSIAQIKQVATKLVSLAKQKGVVIIIVGHINKEGTIAGPKLLEHLVDVVLQMEGDDKRGFRILRGLKNRYGSTNEVGLFEMDDAGMKEVKDPALYFLEDTAVPLTGVCLGGVMEGNRVLIMEVQALTVGTPYTLPKRVTEGISKPRLELLTAIISKYGRINLNNKDIYLNIAGGFRVKDPALDLAVVLAIISSVKEKPLPAKLVAFGEVSLTGRIRKVVRGEQRKKEMSRLGYKTFDHVFKGVNDIRSLLARI